MLSGAPAAAQSRELLYVANNHGGTISVIDVATLAVIGQFNALPDLNDRESFGGNRADDVVTSRSGEMLYVSRPITRDIAAFSTATEQLVWRAPMPGIPDHFALSPDGRLLFVAIINENRVVALDTRTRAIVGGFATAPMPHVVHLSPDGGRVYVGALTGDQVTVADARTFEVIRRLEFADGVRPFVITDDERTMYVQLSKLHGFVEVDLPTGAMTKTVHLPNPDHVPAQQSYPHTAHHGMALTPDGRHLCVAATVQHYAAILSIPDLRVRATVPVGREPSWVVASPDGRYCYVSARRSDEVSVLSVAELRELKRIKVGEYPQRMWTATVPARRGGDAGPRR